MCSVARLFPIILLSVGCSAQHNNGPTAPHAIDDGWTTAHLESQGLNATIMDELDEHMRQDTNGDLRGIAIARNGHLIFEQYFNGHQSDDLHDIRSATKSITSALIGIALSDGLLEGLDAKIIPLIHQCSSRDHNDIRKKSITVEHLLLMSSGLSADEDDPTTPGFEDRLWEARDWVKFACNLPMSSAPGERWAYASVNTFLLGVLIEDAARKTLSQFAVDRLFTPLQISHYHWASNAGGRTVAQGNLSLRLRDMMKLGQLYLNEGRWEETQIVPVLWVQESIQSKYAVPWDGYDGYGYGWYSHTQKIGGVKYQYFFASGNGGNKIYVLPAQRMVVAIQSAAYNTGYGQRRSFDILKRILTAIDERNLD